MSIKSPKISLHVGVHKTATTYFQSRIFNSEASLFKNNISSPDVSSLRRGFVNNLDSVSSREIYNFLFPYFNSETLFISDENVLGELFPPRKKKIYPDALPRLRKLKDALQGFEAQVHIVLRDYFSYLISRYSEYVRHYDFMTFEEYTSSLSVNEYSWLGLVEDVVASGFCDVKVYLFDEIVSNEEKFLSSLLMLRRAELSEASRGAEFKRESISLDAYELLLNSEKVLGCKNVKRVMSVIDKTTEKPRGEKFMPFSNEVKEKLYDKFWKDVNEISKIRGVDLVRF